MKKKSIFPKWLLILDILVVVLCFIPIIKILAKKLIKLVIVLNVVLLLLRFIRNRKRQKLVSDVAAGVAVGIQESNNPEVNSKSVQQMDIFG